MTNPRSQEVWQRIVSILDDQLQYGFLEQAKSVVDVQLEGSELKLCVSSDEALEFFAADVNQQRLLIISRPVVSLDKISVELVEAEPIK
ncbi:hypothetical protein BVY02_02105 [bacterium J17]|nr:hypothetical protein BVY02_02105 [bacterium J17]